MPSCLELQRSDKGSTASVLGYELSAVQRKTLTVDRFRAFFLGSYEQHSKTTNRSPESEK